MTAEEKLREVVERLSEQQAEETLRFIDARADDLTRRLANAPLEDEDLSPEEEEAVREAREELAAGFAPVSHEEIQREFGTE
jgi:hypothetical protein